MFFKLRSNIIFRNYESFGYITDNRNFGYKLTNNCDKDIGDRILSESGAVFLSVLSRKPQSIDELARNVNKLFADTEIKIIKNDAIEFYYMLERDGFILSGETAQECNEKDIRFSYKNIEPNTSEEWRSPNMLNPDKATQEFLEEYFKGQPQLTNLHIEITSKCNERCVHCYIPHDKKVHHIEPNLFYDVLEQCKKMRLLHLTLSGGEPMLHKKFCDFLRKCKEYDFSVNVLSNLTLLDDEIVREMKTNPLLGVQVSLYSMNPHIHDEITQLKGSFKKTRNAILKLIANDIPLQISCPIIKQNKSCYGEVIKWAEKYKIHVGADYVIIGGYDNSIQNLSCRLSPQEIMEVIEDKVASDVKYLEQVELTAENKKNITLNDYICSVCHSSICIKENGNVYPCAGWQNYVVGNVKETSLNDIWDNSEKVQYLRGLCYKDFPKCLECSDKEFCNICMVINANENPHGDLLAVNDFLCNIAKLNKQIMLYWKGKLGNGYNCNN
jgi:radical SAM protein with 4Fe4S-binding SPASM domain